MRPLHWFGGLAVVTATGALTAALSAPAAWVGDWLATRGALRLVHCAGTVWNGSGLLAVRNDELWTVLPGRVAWTVGIGELLSGTLALSLTHPSLDNPVRVTAGGGKAEITAGSGRLPAALLVAAGVPFNTLRPEGDLHLQWSELKFERQGVTGRMELTWRDARSALSPVAPLGSFQLTGTGSGKTGNVQLRTLQGPLFLEGSGVLDEQRLRFKGTADAAPGMREGLASLLGVLGRRNGDKVLLEWELLR